MCYKTKYLLRNSHQFERNELIKGTCICDFIAVYIVMFWNWNEIFTYKSIFIYPH